MLWNEFFVLRLNDGVIFISIFVMLEAVHLNVALVILCYEEASDEKFTIGRSGASSLDFFRAMYPTEVKGNVHYRS